MRQSFGHFMPELRLPDLSVTRQTASAATSDNAGTLSKGIRGRSIREKYSPRPGGECHDLPRRPRPLDCLSDKIIVPSGAPDSAILRAVSLVEPIVLYE
jgi:hypothetical protein